MDKQAIITGFGTTLVRSGAKYLATALVAHGLMKGGSTEAFIGFILALAAEGWSLWNSYGKAIALGSLDILRAKVQFAAEKARANPTTATASLTNLDAHVMATMPPVPSPAPPVASLILFAIGLCVLALAWAGPAAAQNGPARVAPARQAPRPLTGDPIQDIKNAVNPGAAGNEEPKLTGDPIADLHSAVKKLGQKVIVHLKLTYALASAPKAGGGVVDQTSAQCAKALVPIMQLVVNGPAPGTVAADDPMALNADEQAIAAAPGEPEGVPVKIEKLRILRLALSGPELNLACGALVQDEVKNGKDLAGKIISLITGAGLVGVGL